MTVNQDIKAEKISINLEPHTMKIGTGTYIVSSSFNNKSKCDIISKLARLIQNDTEQNLEV